VYLLYLYGEAGVLLFYGVANCVVPTPELLVLMAHNIVSVLNGLTDLLLACLCKLELHDGIVLEFRLAHDVQPPFGLREDGEGREVLFRGGEAAQVFDDEVWVLAELDEEVLVSLYAFEVPVVALEDEVEVYLGVAGQLHLYVLRKLMLVLHHQLHTQLLWLFQRLHHLRLLLDSDHEAMLRAVHHLTAFRNARVTHRTGLHAQQFHE
jgi:hypothetical protein